MVMDQATGWHKRAATGHMEPGHSTADRPVHRLLQSCPSPPLGINAAELNQPPRSNWPAERAHVYFYGNAHTAGSSSPEPEPTLPDSNRRCRRRESRDSPQRRPATTRYPAVPSPQTAFAPTPSRPVPSPSRRPESFELPRLSRQVVHRAAAAAAVTRRGGNSGAGCRDPAVMRGSEYGCDPTGK